MSLLAIKLLNKYKILDSLIKSYPKCAFSPRFSLNFYNSSASNSQFTAADENLDSSTLLNEIETDHGTGLLEEFDIDHDINSHQQQQTDNNTDEKNLRNGKTSSSASKTSLRTVGKINEKIVKYVNENCKLDPEISKIIPKRMFRITKTSLTNVYLINESLVKNITKYLKDIPKTSPIIEISPGFGYLTKELVHTLGFKNVNCFEEGKDLIKYLQKSLNSNNLNFIELSFFAFPTIQYQDKEDLSNGNRVNSILEQIKVPPEKEHLIIIGAVPSINLVSFLINTLVGQKIFFDENNPKWKRPIFYFIVNWDTKTLLLANPEDQSIDYRAKAVLFQTLFNHEILEYFPRQAFIPWETLGKRKIKRRDPDDIDKMVLIKFWPNENFIEKIGRENLFNFFYFIKSNLQSRKHAVIPELEKWMPGCGPKLIRKGYNIFTKFKKLTPQQITDIYFEFISWPDFHDSSFPAAVEKYTSHFEMSDSHEEDIADEKRNKDEKSDEASSYYKL